MRTTKIAENSIVIDIHKSELESFGIDANSLCYSKPKERQFIKQAIEDAKKTIDFDTNNSRILIELFPKISGSCKLIVTKLSNVHYYVFEHKENLIKAINAINIKNYEAYTDEKIFVLKTDTEFMHLNEYGTKNSNPDFELFISEHFDKIYI